MKYSLYREALDLYKYQPDHLRDMTRLYADYLYEQSNQREAAIGKIQTMFRSFFLFWNLAIMD